MFKKKIYLQEQGGRYIVRRMVNTIRYSIGQPLTRKEVEGLFPREIEVEICGQGRGFKKG